MQMRGLLLIVCFLLAASSVVALSKEYYGTPNSHSPHLTARKLLRAQAKEFAKRKEIEKQLRQNQNEFTQSDAEEEYTVHYFDQRVSHFEFNNDRRFKQKYLIRDKFVKPDAEVFPIFFYCGNEGPVEMFYNNSGFLNNVLAAEFNALVVYMEHRYFGDSWPFGDEQESFKRENLVYLTSLQALHDYTNFLDYLRRDVYNCTECPIIAFGGSYGGMLAAWIRMKFPNVVDGAIASSAPIVYFWNREGLDKESFFHIATIPYEKDGCSLKIREGYARLQAIRDKPSPYLYKFLSNTFNLCTPITNVTGIDLLANWLDAGFQYMAMLNYPYETDFLKPLPAWPANSSCAALTDVQVESSDYELFTAMRNAVEYYYNYQQTEQCNEIYEDQSSDQDMSGWNILACSDMVMPMSSNGVNDMFRPMPWNNDAYTAFCQYTWGLTPALDWALDFYGGRTDEEYRWDSNIFLSNGAIDPWSGGGVYYNNDLDVDYVYMWMCAHHLDLRDPNPKDPIYVVQGRDLERQAITRYIQAKDGSSRKSAKRIIDLE